MNTAYFDVSGLNNAQMKTSLKNALDKLEGVQSVDIDKTLGAVEVEFNEPADPNGIRACIEKQGFGIL